MIKRLKTVYKENRLVRIILQFIIILFIYFVIRAWKSMDNIRGAAPVIKAQMLQGEVFDLRDNINQKNNKPILVHFWATWCPVCELENSNIVSLAEDYQVVTIASWSEGAVNVTEYLSQQKLDMPVIVDEDGEWAKLYGVNAVPKSFFIDSRGMIRFIESGYTTEAGLRLRLWWLGQ